LVPTLARLKLLQACDQWHSSRVATFLSACTVNSVQTLKATDHYTCKGDPNGEEWSPIFTQHGFRYVEVTGLDAPPTLDMITAINVRSAVEQIGTVSFSDDLINQVQHNILWGRCCLHACMPACLSACLHACMCLASRPRSSPFADDKTLLASMQTNLMLQHLYHPKNPTATTQVADLF
jgi:hypothetical protein